MVRFYHLEEVKQGTEEWLRLRAGLLTGTDAYDILSGKSIEQILYRKANNSFGGNYYTRRGHVLEDEAREIYSEVYNKITQMGFIKNDNFPLCGYSPDGLIGGIEPDFEGLWECKAFNKERHLKVYKELDVHVLAQIQFGLMITELPWCDLTLYNPDMEDVNEAFLVKRVYPDKDIQDNLISRLTNFSQNYKKALVF